MNTSKKAKNETYPTQTQDVRALLNAKPDTWPAEPIDPGKPLKWQTRRIMAPQPRGDRDYRYDGYDDDGCHYLEVVRDGQPTEIYVHVDRPPFLEGDRLWVRETFCEVPYEHEHIQLADGWISRPKIAYRADSKVDYTGMWKPSIHMPREAARLFLEVREVRAEGSYLDRCECLPRGNDKTPVKAAFSQKWCHVHGTEFRASWDAINAKKGCPWESAPWVWVCEFMRVEGQKHV